MRPQAKLAQALLPFYQMMMRRKKVQCEWEELKFVDKAKTGGYRQWDGTGPDA